MFDLDRFVKRDFTYTPVEIINGENFATRLSVNTPALSDRYTDIRNSLYANTRFCTDGIHYSIRQYPVSDYVLDNLLYIQSFSYQENGPQFYTVRDNTTSFQILFTYDGCGVFEYQNKRYTLGPGDGIFINCRLPSEYRTIGKSWKHCVLHLNGKNAEYLYSLYDKNGDVSFHQSITGHFQETLERIPHYMHLATPYRDIDVSNTLENLILMLIRSKDDYRFTGADVPDNIHAVVDYMYSHYAEEVSLDDLAVVSGYNKFYLCRLFKKHFNMSPQEYVIQLRIQRAKELLRDTEMPIQNIGNLTGIHDPNYFYRLFKSRSGVSPASYRKNTRR